MLSSAYLHKFVSLADGRQVLLRSLFRHDREGLLQMLNGVPEDEVRFLQPPGQEPRQEQAWLAGLDYREVVPLVAVDLAAHRFAGIALLTRDRLGAGGRVHLFAVEPFRRLGLPGLRWQKSWTWPPGRTCAGSGPRWPRATAWRSRLSGTRVLKSGPPWKTCSGARTAPAARSSVWRARSAGKPTVDISKISLTEGAEA